MSENFKCPNCGQFDFEIQDLLLSHDYSKVKQDWKNLDILIRYKCFQEESFLTIPLEYYINILKMNNKLSEKNKLIKKEKNKNEEKIMSLNDFYNNYQSKFIQYETKLTEEINKNKNLKIIDEILKKYISFNYNLINLFELYLKTFHFSSNKQLNQNFLNSIKCLISKLNEINEILIQKQILFLEEGNYTKLYFFQQLTLTTNNFNETYTLNGHTLPIVGLYQLRNGKILSGSCGIFNIWKEDEEDKIFKLEKQFYYNNTNLINSFLELEDNIILFASGKTIIEMNIINYSIIICYIGFTNSINTIITMKNNSIIICGGVSNEIMIWNRNNSNKIKIIIPHPQLIFINSLLNLNNQNFFASASTNSRVIIYDLNNLNNDDLKFQEIIEDETHLLKLCNVYQNDFCVSTMQGKIHYYKWNGNKYNKNYTFIGNNDKEIYGIVQLRNGYLISVHYDENIKVWDLENKQCVTIIKDNNQNNLIIQLNDGRICTASTNKIIKILDFNYYK